MTPPLERLPNIPSSLAVMLAVGCLLAPTLAADIAVVTRESTPVDALGEAEVKALWLGTIERVGGTRLSVADRSEADLRAEFYRRVLHKTRGQVKAIRAKRAFQHGIAPPPEFPNDKTVLLWVRARDNRLGYIDTEAVGLAAEDPADGSVKVLLTIEVPKGSDEP